MPREPTNKNEKELKEQYDKAYEKVLFLVESTPGINQSWMTFLLYLSSENLVKHSKTLSIWTIVIGVSTILLFISAIAQLIKLFFFP